MGALSTLNVGFLDFETTGLDPERDEPWEVALIKRDYESQMETRLHFQVEHDRGRVAALPLHFRQDYNARWATKQVLTREGAARGLRQAFTSFGRRDVLVGAGPVFEVLMTRGWFGEATPWHYQIKNIEDLAAGYLAARVDYDRNLLIPDRRAIHAALDQLPYKSDHLSRLLGVDPAKFDRHTAMGDVEWVRAQWDVIYKNTPLGWDVNSPQPPVNLL